MPLVLRHHPRPSHPALNVRDRAYAPHNRERDGLRSEVIWVRDKAKYFSRGDWTTQITLNRQRKSGFARKSFLGL
jgi:hypothetical protein